MCSGIKSSFRVADISFPIEAQLTKLIDAGMAFSKTDNKRKM